MKSIVTWEMINRIRKRDPRDVSTREKVDPFTYVYFGPYKRCSEVRRLKINDLLQNETDDSRVELTRGLLDLWCKGDSTEARTIFGHAYQKYGKQPLVATLTGRHNQLRYWLEQGAERVEMTHTDSCGDEYLFEISTRPRFLHEQEVNPIRLEYLTMALELLGGVFELPNGGKVYGRGDEENRPSKWVARCSNGKIDYDSHLRK
jgi:hypothetical protein